MIFRSRSRHAAPLLVAAILAGLWLSHTLEIWQLTLSGVQFSGGVSLSPFGGVHNYMVGLGVCLLALSALCGQVLWRVWWRLCDRLEVTRFRFRQLLRTGGGTPLVCSEEAAPSAPVRLLSLWLPVLSAQILLYILQENLEASAVGHVLPGFSVLYGVHWAAPFIHAAVALVLSAAILWAARKLEGKSAAIARVHRACVAHWNWISRAAKSIASTTNERVAKPADRLGVHLWQRPPPIAA